MRVEIKPAIRLPLGGDGVRGLSFDDAAGRFLVISGPAGSDRGAPYRVLQWPGSKSLDLREVTRFTGALDPEGITSVVVGDRRMRLIVFDTGEYLTLR